MKTIISMIPILIGSVSLFLEKLDTAIAEAKTYLEDHNPKLHKHLEDN